jgi:hypothetical protein
MRREGDSRFREEFWDLRIQLSKMHGLGTVPVSYAIVSHLAHTRRGAYRMTALTLYTGEYESRHSSWSSSAAHCTQFYGD